MNDDAGQTIFDHMTMVKLPGFFTPAKNEHADVGTVGTMMARLRTACLLGRAGRTVIVLDNGSIVSGATVRTTACLVTAAGKPK